MFSWLKKFFGNTQPSSSISNGGKATAVINPDMQFLIVGLGNIGEKYDNTRHNVGFDVVDYLAKEHQASFELTRHAYKSSFRYKGKIIHLLKPTTYMNLSGKAVRYWMQQEKIKIDNVLIVLDDLNLEFGKIRMRTKGSDGGHNGLKNIDQLLGTNKYARLRIGIGSNFSRGKQVNYVLGKWSEGEHAELQLIIEKSARSALAFATIGIARAMSQYNG